MTTSTPAPVVWDRVRDSIEDRDCLLARLRKGDRVRVTYRKQGATVSIDGPCWEDLDGAPIVGYFRLDHLSAKRIEAWPSEAEPEPLPDFTTALAWADVDGDVYQDYYLSEAVANRRDWPYTQAPWTPLRTEAEWRELDAEGGAR